jgi:Ca2+-binding EF-hand superfamily protein
MKYNLSDEAIQEIITTVSGQGKREITWEQFNNYLAKKIERKNNSAA